MSKHPHILVLLAGCVLAAGCERSATTTRKPPQASPPATPSTAASRGRVAPRSPIEVVRALHADRQAGRYDDMAALVAAPQRVPITELVLSVDELVAAESALRRTIQERVGEGSAAYFEQRAQVANIIGPLSRDVKVISEHIDGDRATVDIQVAGRVPLEQVELRRDQGKWLVWPDKPIPGLAAELRHLAEATRRVSTLLERREMEADEVFRELARRQQPALERMAKLTAQSDADTNIP